MVGCKPPGSDLSFRQCSGLSRGSAGPSAFPLNRLFWGVSCRSSARRPRMTAERLVGHGESGHDGERIGNNGRPHPSFRPPRAPPFVILGLVPRICWPLGIPPEPAVLGRLLQIFGTTAEDDGGENCPPILFAGGVRGDDLILGDADCELGPLGFDGVDRNAPAEMAQRLDHDRQTHSGAIHACV